MINEAIQIDNPQSPACFLPHVIGCLSFFNADNLEIMRGFKDKEFDLAIVDPPYGLERFKANDGGNSKKITTFGDKDKNWNNIKPTAEYWEQLFRISKNQIIWGGNYFELPPCKNYIIWDKEIPKGLSFADCEQAWTSFDCAPKMFRYSAYLDKNDKFHPTQKPVDLYSWILQNYSKQGFKIIDTHLGSASIAIAIDKANKFDNMNLEFVGIELDKDYFEASMKRFNNYRQQKTIFE